MRLLSGAALTMVGCAPALILRDQSCLLSPVCTSVPIASTGEVVIAHGPRALQAIRTLEALLTLERILSTEELDFIESRIKECVRQADFVVNEATYGKGGRPDDAECLRVLRGSGRDTYTQAMELGRRKHEAAVTCIRSWLNSEFSEVLAVEQSFSFRPPATWSPATAGSGTLRPDLVLQVADGASPRRCIYEFKFPCTLASRSNPHSMAGVSDQLNAYQRLTLNCPAVLVTPQLGISP